MNYISMFSVIFLGLPVLFVQAQERKSHLANRVERGNVFEIDGLLNESHWQNNTTWSTDFIQRMPNEGSSPSEQTKFSVLYDDKFLYVGIYCEEEDNAAINRRMSRRDGYNGDWVEVTLDSYHDSRTAFSFTISAAGVKSDKYITLNGAEEDIAWNPIWNAQSRVIDNGWSAEMKIPLSQLRFSNTESQLWGLQVQRRILRNEELSLWQRVPLDAPGWISEFGLLEGIRQIRPQHQLEIQPFIVGSIQTFEKDPENPFRNSNVHKLNAGIDGKIGLTNDITLDFTINPDFGQVEADPAAIALDGFQLFFEEQRPFFIENKNIFNYRFNSPVIGSPYGSDNLFYSRRVGRKPQRTLALDSNVYADVPQKTTILGALKLSGKTKKGLSFGLMESITSREQAEISDGQKELIEPQTNYLVGRVLQDLNDQKTFLGAMFTATTRVTHPETNFLHQSAETLGVDFLHQWQDRNWYAGMNLITSRVSGSREAILATQQSIPHLFQRGASHLNVDSTKTSLTGFGGDIKIGKAGNGNFQGEAGLTWRSPELALNDIGFMREADIIQQYMGLSYRSVNSFSIFRNASIGYQHWINWDYEGKLNYVDWDISTEASFQNNWSATLGYFNQPHTYSKSLLQGGPRIKLADQYGWWWALNTDSRKKFFINYSGWVKTGGAGSYYLLQNGISFSYQPVDRFRFSLGPRFTKIRHRLQYNESLEINKELRHVVSLLDQNTFGVVTRFDVVLSPNMAIQYYAEPFISQGKYDQYGLVDRPLASYTENQIDFLNIIGQGDNGQLHIDINQDEISDNTIGAPNFSFAQFRSNLVYRWEYRPGSEFYLVWSQGITDHSSPDTRLLPSLRDQIFSRVIGNTFLFKMTYRFHR